MLALLLLATLASAAPIETATDIPCLSSWTHPANGGSIEEITSSWPAVPFRLLGGFSPYFDADGVYGIRDDSLPSACKVNQVQLYMRHGMREASGGTHAGLLALAKKLQTTNWTTDDPTLSYLMTWNWTQPAELLTPLGAAGAYANGVAFQHRYDALLPYFNGTGSIPVRSTDQQRVNATAEAFTRGLFGESTPQRTSWLVTPDSLASFNSTLASNNCPASSTITYSNNTIFNAAFQPQIVERLSRKLPGFNLTTADVSAMMNACPFDSFALQRPSPFCSMFTEREWHGYNYAYDLNQFDNAGYGGPIGAAWGVGWVAEMIARLNDSQVVAVGSVNRTQDAQPFPASPIYLDFTHDTSLESAITAMRLLPAAYDGHVSVDDIDANRAWQSALISPMGGRLQVERLQCTHAPSLADGHYIRLVLNNAVVPLEPLAECQRDTRAAALGLCKVSNFIASQSYALSGGDFENCGKSELTPMKRGCRAS